MALNYCNQSRSNSYDETFGWRHIQQAVDMFQSATESRKEKLFLNINVSTRDAGVLDEVCDYSSLVYKYHIYTSLLKTSTRKKLSL